MAISTYSELKQAIQDWLDRTDISANTADMVTLAEAGLNRLLKTVESDATLTGTLNSRSISISSLNITSPIALFITDPAQSTEIKLVNKPDGSFPYTSTSGFPSFWAIDGTNIDFDCPLDQTYSFRFRYVGRFALSNSVTTNALLANDPDIYLAACIVWGGLFTQDDAAIARFAGPLSEFIRQRKKVEEQNRRGRMTVDPALSAIGRGNISSGNTGW